MPNSTKIRPCVARVHLRGADFSVYDAAMALTAHSDGPRILSASRETLARMTGYGLRAVGCARERLVKKGFLEPVASDWQEHQRFKSGKSGSFAVPKFRIVEHDEWALSHPGECPTVVRSTAHGKSADAKTDDAPSVDRDATDTVVGQTTDTVHGQPYHNALIRSPKEKPAQVRRTPHGKRSFDGDGRKKKLRDGLVRKIKQTDESLKAHLDYFERQGERYPEWWRNVRSACEFVGYRLDESDATVTVSFAGELANQFEKHEDAIRSGDMNPGIFASKVVDQLMRNKELFPPSFVECRDRLRSQERRAL
jgi:hypothetical protein